VKKQEVFSEHFNKVASDNGIRTQCSKVHPSPGVARSVWALPLTSSCNMASEENDHHAEDAKTPADDKDSNRLSIIDSTEMLIQTSMDDIFEVIKSG
jgi:palmitoyltransferase ZDHHC13/17